MQPWMWPLILLAIGLGLATLEIFFPSAGILAILSAAALLGAVLLGLREGPSIGFTILGAVVLGVPTLVLFAFRWWPHTAIGKRVLLDTPRREDVLPDTPDHRRLKDLVGRIGYAQCKMLPGGVVKVDGIMADAVSEGTAIEAGQRVLVIKAGGRRIVVRPADEEPAPVSEDDPLQRPIDSVASDPFAGPWLDKDTLASEE